MNALNPSILSFRLLMSDLLWLKPEHFAKAKLLSAIASDEQARWQLYIQSLALSAVQSWLQERLTNANLSRLESASSAVSYLSVERFRLCIIGEEHVLDELLRVPRVAVDSPEQCAHYYVWIEVLEEQQEALIRGWLRYDELTDRISRSPQLQSLSDADYSLPLAALNGEPNHLLSYIQCLNADAIALPASPLSISSQTHPAQSTGASVAEVSDSLSRLGEWLEGAVSTGWRTLDSLINREAQLAWAMRSRPTAIEAGKLVNLGVQLSEQAVILLVTAVPEEDEKIGVHIQVLPKGGQSSLPPQLSVALISSRDELLQEVTSQDQDDFIQLRYFKGKPGIRFSIEISFGIAQAREAFEL